MRQKLFHVLTIALLLFAAGTSVAQETEPVKVKEYYWVTPLTKVFSDLINKYHLKVEYDSAEVASVKLNYDFGGTSPDLVFAIIVRENPELDFIKDEDAVYHVFRKSTEKPEGAGHQNIRFKGAAEKTNMNVSGIVKDKNTGESLPFATVIIRGTTIGTTTNQDGYFTIFKVPTDTSALIANYMGYENTIFFLRPKMPLDRISIEMEPAANELQEVQIIEEREDMLEVDREEISVMKMSPRITAVLPNIGENDVLRSFQLLPGVSGTNESSSGLYVRGGTPDQNLILYDGFTVYHVDHLFGMFSAFNANAIKDVKLYKGGFDTQFGGRISSVMEIVGKDGNDKKFNVGGSLSLMSFNAFIEFPLGKKINFLAAARKSWRSPIYNAIFNQFNEAEDDQQTTQPSGLPAGGPPGGGPGGRVQQDAEPKSYFYDVNAKLSYKPSEKDIITLSFFNGSDDLDNSRENNFSFGGSSIGGGTTDKTTWGNWGSSLNWSRKWSEKLYSNNMASYSQYYSLKDQLSEFTRTDTSGEETTNKRGSIEDNDLHDITFKSDWEWKVTNHHQFEMGVQGTYLNVLYDYAINDTITVQDRNDKEGVAGLYIQDRIKFFKNRVTVVAGARVDYYSGTDNLYPQPRASFLYNITPKLALKGAWGLYYQYANRIIRSDLSSGSRDFWVLANDVNIPVASSYHYILGASYETKGFLFDVEAYYKTMKGLSEYTLQFTPSFTNVNFDEYFYTGTGKAAGIDFLIQKKYGKYTGWIGYSISRTLYNFDIYGEQSFYASHDVTNELKLVNSYKWRKWTFSATWVYGTGKPYTPALGGYSLELLNGTTSDYIDVGNKNSQRLPDYHRLDIAINWAYKLGDIGKGTIGFSLFNVYNRSNVWYKEYSVVDGTVIETDVNSLGILPNLTLSFQLR
ncbi:MAG: TonB-dependent receptor [Flavobacteriales bacterium]|nr:TonB-dependent receptor [Flavobacteriales bacterium]